MFRAGWPQHSIKYLSIHSNLFYIYIIYILMYQMVFSQPEFLKHQQHHHHHHHQQQQQPITLQGINIINHLGKFGNSSSKVPAGRGYVIVCGRVIFSTNLVPKPNEERYTSPPWAQLSYLPLYWLLSRVQRWSLWPRKKKAAGNSSRLR